MDYMTAAAAAVTAIGGWQAVRYLLNLRAERRKAALGNKRDEIDIMRGVLQQLEAKEKELSAKVDELYRRVHALEKEKIDLIKENSLLKVELERAKRNECLRPDDDCLRRMPDRDYCRLVRLARGKYDEYHKPTGGDGVATEIDTAKDGKEEETDGDDEEEEHH